MWKLDWRRRWTQFLTFMKTKEEVVDRACDNFEINVEKVDIIIKKSVDGKAVARPEHFKSVSSHFSVKSTDPWFVSVTRSLELSVMESVSLLGSSVTGMVRNSLTSKSTSPVFQPLTVMDKQVVGVEVNMLVDRMDSNSDSLMKDMEQLNRKLAIHPWLRNRDDFRDKLLRRMRLLDRKGEERILVKECKARLGEREALTSPGVRVLSLDGGGMSLLMLEELEKMTGAKTHQMFDLIVGTSTGAVIASMMGISCTGASEGLELYMEMGRKIFKRSMVEGVGGLIHHQGYYDHRVMEEVLKTYLGDIMLFDTCWTREVPAVAFISSMVTNKVQPHMFSNYMHPSSSKPPFPHTTSLPLWQAIMASCAAPGYFSQVVISGTTHVDGAMVANNPTQLALLESMLLWPEEKLHCLLSLGSGRPEYVGMEEYKSVSTKDMFSRSLDVLADTETVHQVLGLLLAGEKYYRLNPPVQEMVEIDEIREKKMEELMRDTRKYIRRNRRLLADLADTLMEKPRSMDRVMRVVMESRKRLGI